MIKRGILFIILVIILLLIIPHLSATPDLFYSNDQPIFSNFMRTNLFLESLNQVEKAIKTKFLNETIKYEFGKFKPKIRKDKDLNDYFKKLDIEQDEIYVLLGFEESRGY